MSVPISPSAQQRGLWILYLAIVLLSCNGLFSKLISLSPLDITVVRSLIAAGCLLLLLRVQGIGLALAAPGHYPLMVALGLFMGLHWITFFHSMQVSSVAVGMLSLYTFPVMTVLVEPFFHGARPRWLDLLMGLVVLGGVYVMVPAFDWNQATTVGIAWGLVSAALLTARNVLLHRYLPRYPSQLTMAYQTAVIGLAFLPWLNLAAVTGAGLENWGLLLLLGAVFTAGGHSLFAESLRSLNAKTVGLISCLQPVLATLLAWLLLDEWPSTQTLAGGAVILAAAVVETLRVNQQSRHQSRHQSRATRD